ncbi:MAG: hypothetical protein HY606_04295 [Planctomycetes bacterium]|nr:hypothetical protein [Planctomycetota bacterium]
MHLSRILFIIGISIFISGCVPSLRPLLTEKDLTFKSALLGVWVDEDNNIWDFQKSGDKSYRLIYTQYSSPPFGTSLPKEGVPAGFDVHLVQIGENLFLDIYPIGPDIKNDFYIFHLIPVHTFAKVQFENDILHIGMLDHDWIKNMIDKEKVSIKHERLGEKPGVTILLTASTRELQEFVLKYAKDPEAFPMGKLHRQKSQQGSSLDIDSKQ